jgi:hypothetical protein
MAELILIARLALSVGLGYIVWFLTGIWYDAVFKDRD